MDSRAFYSADKVHSLSGVVAGVAVVCALHAHGAIHQGAAAYHGAVVGSGEWLRDADLAFLVETLFFGVPLIFYGWRGVGTWWRRTLLGPRFGDFRSSLATLQGWTGLYLLVFGASHLLRVWTVVHLDWGGAASGPSPTLDGAVVGLATHVTAVAAGSYFATLFHALGIFAAAFHVSYGLWNFGVNWGITSGPRAMARSMVFCSAMFALLFTLGINTLAVFVALGAGGGA